MDRVGEETFQLGKSAAAILTAPANGNPHERQMESKRSANGVGIVRAAGRKDRHSKVFTARGTRDRRVRLSPKTAILFYDVQERLGCDRPSKALDWLMNEAKAAIDGLPPAAAATAADTFRSTATNVAESNNDGIVNHISGFSFFDGEAAPLPPTSRSGAGDDREEEQFMPAPTHQELFDANSEMVRLQRFFSLNYSDCVSSTPLHYPAPANYHSFGEREPLQSSYSRINYSNSSQFQGFEFVGEDDPELPVFSKSGSFIHYE